MTTLVDPYCQIHGYDLGSIVYANGVEPSGGSLGVEELPVPGRNYANIRSKGRAAKKYKIRARSTDREEIEAFLMEVNTAPEDSLFYPFDAERFGLIASAFAAMKGTKQWGVGKNFYEADAEITCREPWLYGADQGIAYVENVDLPQNETVANSGQERAPISYLQMSGEFDDSEYATNVYAYFYYYLGAYYKTLMICDKLLRDDKFELSWRGEVKHGYEVDFSKKTLSAIYGDLHGKILNGAITSGKLTLDGGDWLMVPFYGPLPCSPPSPLLELWVTAKNGGAATAQVSFETDISDMTEIDFDLEVGYNAIPIPGCEGAGHVAIGLKADSGSGDSVTLSALKASINRYVAPSQIPSVEAGETAIIGVNAGGAGKLRMLQAIYNDIYYH